MASRKEMDGQEIEEVAHQQQPTKESTDNDHLLYDKKTGVVLSPQPSKDPNDPLNWPMWFKWFILVQLSFAAFQNSFNSALLIPNFPEIAEYYHVTEQKATYLVSIVVIFNALGPLTFQPLSAVYGRRGLYIATFGLATITSIAGAFCQSWGAQAATRALNGLALGSATTIGASSISDLFFLHQRGKAVGLWALLTNTGAFWATFISFYIAAQRNFFWCFYVSTLLSGLSWVLMIFTFPETLYPRINHIPRKNHEENKLDIYDLMVVFRRRHKGKLNPFTILRPIYMCRYPAVILPALAIGMLNSFAAVGTGLTQNPGFVVGYGFSEQAAGNMSLFLIFGSLLGEIFAGAWSDFLMTRKAKKMDGKLVPEMRLDALWPALFLAPLGLILYGVFLLTKTAWIGSAMGMGIAIFAYQIVVTVGTAYAIDSYRPQAGYVATLINAMRQLNSFFITLYNTPFVDRANFGWTFGTYAIVTVVTLLPVLYMRFVGEKLRRRIGDPPFDMEL